MKQRLRAVAEELDPLRLLDEIHAVQQHLAALAAGPLDGFLKGLGHGVAAGRGPRHPFHRAQTGA